ncbi:N-terminal double-transmembrane domain-containing protein [Salinihabitans flavidus]|uniref:N-terminal double-transmembrane domain-containing protein n=1 Tax=Salinihabitans flavidus TaxID=569882 RepID=A0A1H8LL52_9RHOB|nr:DUF4159 domain-containing protein [Salinihabitans flavidus]SEO05845.1 N-terminal double-transmembrane domain-containing protein [Salinihabitans flavidus]
MAGLPLAFAAPWLLLALAALPVLWLILRAIPPAPVRRLFPGVVLLLGLKDDDSVSDRTPWWLLLLRMLAVAAVIVGLAGPVLNPQPKQDGRGPLLILMDGGWASADGWTRQREVIAGMLEGAARDGRRVAMMRVAAPEPALFQPAGAWRSRLPGFAPVPWQPDAQMAQEVIESLGDARFDTRWISDGLDGPQRAPLLRALEARGDVTIHQDGAPVYGVQRPRFEGGEVTIVARRSVAGIAAEVTALAQGRDPAGNETVLASLPLTFGASEHSAEGALSLPREMSARITHFTLREAQSAGAVALSDDSLRRREVALIAGRQEREELQLLSPLHYLRQALVDTAEVLEGPLTDILPANPDVVVLADVAVLAPAEEEALTDWVDEGGLLLRFAGPRLAASDVSREAEHPLMPVRLRVGGRSVGGAMTWGEPKSLAPFDQDSPFHGLEVPDDLRVSAQVMAQPDPALADRVIAQLSDGTPLVTRKGLGEGQVVLFHVTANAEWSGLPLSGLFVRMLDRLAVLSATDRASAKQMEGTIWQPVRVLDGQGDLHDGQALPGVAGEDLSAAPLGPDLRPGLYREGDRLLARNVVTEETDLTPMQWPARLPVEGLGAPRTVDLSGGFLAAALIVLVLDVIGSLLVSGRLTGLRAGLRGAAVLIAALVLPFEGQAQEGDDARAIRDTREVVLAHVVTGDARLDEAAQAGLRGLSEVLFFRTSIEPNAPAAVDLERDELAFYPFLYWPVSPDQPIPSDVAYGKLNAYLRSGGMILFDTRDADVARFGASGPNGRKLQRLAEPLDIPPLEPVPDDHVLTRTFYLLQDFPGRYQGRDVWVEAAPPDAEQIEGMPFRNLNDGVTPVVIGGNDWAAAWAVDERGNSLYPVGRGRAGERQRELSYRFGVNLIMHVLSGNYKSDQVHVPALLDRLGQ